MNTENPVKGIKHTIANQLPDPAETVEESKKIAKQSLKDWVNYLCSHPAQSLLFGATIFLAIKGLRD